MFNSTEIAKIRRDLKALEVFVKGKPKERQENLYSPFQSIMFSPYNFEATPLVDEIQEIFKKLNAIEKFLKIQYREETCQFKGYKPVKVEKKNKRGRPKGSRNRY